MYSEVIEPVVIYSGHRGSSDERVAMRFGERLDRPDVLPLSSISSVVSTVDLTEGVLGVVPLEDSIHGEFTRVVWRLLFETKNALIADTIVLSERIWVQALDPTRAPEVIHSHPALLEEYGDVINELGLEIAHSVNSHEACQLVAAQGNPAHVALAPDVVAARAGLVHHGLLESRFLDVHTRYALLGRDVGEPTPSTRTMALICPLEDRVGTLANIIEVFRSNGINLTSLKSVDVGNDRPHHFLVEFHGHPVEPSVATSLLQLFGQDVMVKIVGVCGDDGIHLQKGTDRPVPGMLDGVDSYQAWIDLHCGVTA